MMPRFGMALLLLLAGGVVEAHKPSDSYMELVATEDSTVIEGRWDIALKDLEHAIGLDGNGDGEITWGELRSSHDAIADYALSHLTVDADDQRCRLVTGEQRVVDHSDGRYTVLSFDAHCSESPATVAVDYSLMFEFDPSHRGLLRLHHGQAVYPAVLSPELPRFSVDLARSTSAAGWLRFVREGVWHIWIGYDHLAFLMLLLLPSVLRYSPQGWRSQNQPRAVILDVAGVVTAFTIAHSITLGLAAFRVVELPGQAVEMAIAASVVIAALHTLRPLPMVRGRWLIAFAFGLVHGFGFASVLRDLGLEGGNLALTLLGFNLGVELGQLAVVLVVLPMIYIMRHTPFYQRGVLPIATLVIGGWGVWWLFERAVG